MHNVGESNEHSEIISHLAWWIVRLFWGIYMHDDQLLQISPFLHTHTTAKWFQIFTGATCNNEVTRIRCRVYNI